MKRIFKSIQENILNNKNKWVFWIEIIIFIGICFMHALEAGHYVDFFPINGTFQDFNPVRRLIDGQIPYKDFQDYLGMGHLYIGTLFTVIFSGGGNYQSSLNAFSFLTFVSLGLIAIVIGLAVFKRKEIAIAITNCILVLILVQPTFFWNFMIGTEEIKQSLKYATQVGYSARYVRGMILPLVCLALYLLYKVYERYGNSFMPKRIRELLGSVIVGIIAGFAFVWSNDYGISCWVCLSIMTFWISLSRYRQIGKALVCLIVEILSSIVGILLIVEVATWGHLKEWFNATFGTGGYQAWYYNSDKSYYIFDVDFSFFMLISAGACVIYLIKLYMAYANKDALRRYGILAFVNMTSFCAVNEYRLLSGGANREVALAVLFFTVLYEVFNYLNDCIKTEGRSGVIILLTSMLMGGAWLISEFKEEVLFRYMETKNGEWIEELGGRMTSLADDVINANKFLAGEKVWSTYASAQEVIEGTFQPSGTDYIIHVLGDEHREKYMEDFEKENFKYVATIKEDYTAWEFWVQRANWFLYRKLYQQWHPVYSNEYELYWERNDDENSNIVVDGFELSLVTVNETTKKIVIQANDEINGIADVYIDYEIGESKGIGSIFMFRKMLRVANTGEIYSTEGAEFESNYLRDKSQEYIPVSIVNGYGEVTLTSNPWKYTYIDINICECEAIYTVSSDYLELEYIISEPDKVAFAVVKNDKYMNAVQNMKAVAYKDMIYQIIDVDEDEDNIILITDLQNEKIAFSSYDENMLRIVRE